MSDTPTAAPTACLTGLIGLSAAGSACFPLPSVRPPTTNDALTVSRSGLYLDAVEGLLLKPAAGQPAGPDLYERLAAARAQALPAVRTALAQRRAASAGVALYNQRGTIGGLGNGSLLAAGSPARMSFYTKYARAGCFRIVSLQLYTDVAVTAVPILLDGLPIGTLSAGGAGGLFVPIDGATAGQLRIPFDGLRHTLEALIPAGVRVRSNSMWCAPCQAGTPWGLALARGLDAAQCATATGGGFAVQVQEECTEPLDALAYALDVDPELSQSVAFALLYTAAELFVLSLAVSAQANRYLMMEAKELDALGTYYHAKAESHVAWLAGPDGLARIKHPCYAGLPNRLSSQRTT